MDFTYIINEKKVIMEPHYLFSKGIYYWPYIICEITNTDLIYDFCFNSFNKMNKDHIDGNVKRFSLPDYLNVKTYRGAVKKVESFQFCWTDWEGYFFNRGQRNSEGFSYFKEIKFENIDIIEKNDFIKAYNKCIRNIEIKIDKKLAKKNT